MNELFTVWNLIRLSGLLAYLLLSISVICGMSSSFPLFKKRKGDLLALHQIGGWVGFLTVIFHLIFILQDQYVEYTISEVLIPFADNENSFSSGIGALSFYIFFIVLFSSDFMLKKIGKARWKFIHFSVFPAWIFMTLHGILIGTDSSEQWVKLLYFSSIVIICILMAVRLMTVRTRQPEAELHKKFS